jgi:actin related protein 2/3 complex subunit 4
LSCPLKLIDFVITFLEEVDKEISHMKIGVNARARLVAETFLREMA